MTTHTLELQIPSIALVGRSLKAVTQRYQIEYDTRNKEISIELQQAHAKNNEGLSPTEFVNKYLPLTDFSTRARNDLIIDMWHKVSRANKFVICSLRCQEGKTWVVIKAIQDQDPGTLNIVSTMNSLLNTEQFTNRAMVSLEAAEEAQDEQQIKELDSEFGENNVCVFSSKNTRKRKNHVKTLNELIGLCALTNKCPKVIVMCAHPTRLREGFDLINLIHTDLHCPHIKKINVYMDELHSYIDMKLKNGLLVRDTIIAIDKLDKVGEIWGITATAGALWRTGDDYFNSLYIHPMVVGYDDSNYCGANNVKFINHELDELGGEREYSTTDPESGELIMHTYSDELSYVVGVLDNNPDLLSGKQVGFIPACREVDTHNQVRNIIMEKSSYRALVVLINGKDKSVTFYPDPNDRAVAKTIRLDKKTGELSKSIYELQINYELRERPIVFTGHICVSMGQTLVDNTIGSFDYVILGHDSLSSPNLYQLFGRVLGRMKGWDKPYNTRCFCSNLVMNKVHGSEKCTNNTKKYGGTSMTHEEFIAPLKNMDDGDLIALDMKAKELKIPKKKDNALRIPIIVSCDKNDKIFTTKLSRDKKIEYCMQQTNSDEFRKLHDFINHCNHLDPTSGYITKPTAPNSINKHITDVIKAADTRKCFIVDHKRKDTNNWQCYIDIHGGNLCFCVYSIDNTYLD